MKKFISYFLIICLLFTNLQSLFAHDPGFYVDEEVDNLYYSEKTNSLYFSIDYLHSDKTGFYIWQNGLQRIYYPQARQISAIADLFLGSCEIPDYNNFFHSLYRFADYGTDPIFATQNSKGEWLFEEDAFNYLCYNDEYEDFIFRYTSQNRFKLENFLYDKSKGFENPVSAFTCNGHPEALESLKITNTMEGFFVENTQGIWYLEKQKDGSGILYKFCSTDNIIEFKIPEGLKEIKIAYSKNSVISRNESLIIKTQNYGYIFYNSITDKKIEFSNEHSLNKYLKKLDYKEHPQVRISKILALLSFIIILLIALFISLRNLVTASKKLIAQANPAKRKTSYTQKEINQKIFSIQEKERQKISRDIHDTVIQDIRVLGIESDMLRLSESDKENIQHKNKIQQISTDCIIKLRNICYNLAPAELSGHTEDDSSKTQLISILNTLSEQFTIRTHIPCSVKVKDDFDYPSFEHSITENLFRIVQEALTNIEKHSFATSVSIFIKTKVIDSKNFIVIYISDDGVGCDTKKLNFDKNAHRGLRNMKERMDLIGGKIEFFSKPNEGLEITLTLEIK